MKTVITISNKRVLKSKTRKFSDNNYYEIDVDCVKLKGKYWRIGKSVDYDHFKNTFNFKKNMVYGIVGSKMKKGYFSDNPNTVTLCLDDPNLNIKCLTKYIAKINNFVLIYGSENHYISKTVFSLFNKSIGLKSSYYNVSDNEFLLHNTTVKLNENLSKNKNRFKKLTNFANFSNATFGIEYETSNGSINEFLEKGLIPLRDGSLKNQFGEYPIEYATCVVEGDNLINAVVNQTNALKYHCSYNEKCSIHLHIGYLETEDIVNLYKLLFNIQDEIFTWFPDYRTNPKKYDINLKEYCKKLPKINFVDEITNPEASLTTINNHNLLQTAYVYADRDLSSVPTRLLLKIISEKTAPNIRKWNNPNRYYWVNLYNLLFKPSRTVEFRIHEATFDKNKILNWTIYCMAILKAAKNKDIALSAFEIIEKYVHPYYQKRLIDYFNHRKFLFAAMNQENTINYLRYD